MPRFHVFRPIGPDIAATADQLLELTETQAQVFEGLYAQDRVLVEGVAGSGKTFLALHRALAFAREGKRTLFVCLQQGTRSLDTQTGRRRSEHRRIPRATYGQELPRPGGRVGRGSRVSGSALQMVVSRTQAFWDDEVPDLMEQAVFALDMAGEPVQFEAIVVDEAQDFSLGWWYALTQSLLDTPGGPVYAFLDPNQSLRGEVQWPPVEFDARFRLKVNCRNTRKIAAASASVLDLEPNIFARVPVGTRPRLLRASTPQHQKGLVLQELKKLLQREDVSPGQIAVHRPAAKTNGSLADVDEIDGVPLVTSVDAWRDGDGVPRDNGSILQGARGRCCPFVRSRRLRETLQERGSLCRVHSCQGFAHRSRPRPWMSHRYRRGPRCVRDSVVMLETITREQLADALRLVEAGGEISERAVANLLRAPLTRWGLAPKHSLLRYARDQIRAAGLEEVSSVPQVLTRMIALGECDEVYVGHEIYVAPAQPRWIPVGAGFGAYLGVSGPPEGVPLAPTGGHRDIVQRIRVDSDDDAARLHLAGVREMSITEWLSPLGYLRHVARRLRRPARSDTCYTRGFLGPA
jgi:hypothetical protein